MADPRGEEALWDAECAAWCRYLVGRDAPPRVIERYREAHRCGVAVPAESATRFDRALVTIARGGALRARLCDAHARLFRPAGMLRRKLVLALALLETDAATHRRVDQVDPGSRAGFVLLCAGWLARSALLVVVGVLLFLPLRLFCALGGKT